MHNNFLHTIGPKPLNPRRLININIPYQHLILQIPNLKLFHSLYNHQMWRQTHFQYLVGYDKCTGPDGKQLLSGLDTVTCYGFLVTVAYTSVTVVVWQVFDDELLADVDNLVDGLGWKVDQFDGELVWTDTKDLAFLVEL